MSGIKPGDQEKGNSDTEPMFKLANETHCLHIKDEEVSRQAKKEMNEKSEELIDNEPSDGSEQKQNNFKSDEVSRQAKKETNEKSEELIDSAPSEGSKQEQSNFDSDEKMSRRAKKEINENSEELTDHVLSDGSEQNQNNFTSDNGVSRQAKKETNEKSEELSDHVLPNGSDQKQDNFMSEEVSRQAKKETNEKSKELIDPVPSDGSEQKQSNFTSGEEMNGQAKKEINENSIQLIDHVASDGTEQKQNNFTSDKGVSRQAKTETNEKSEELSDHVLPDGSDQKQDNCMCEEVSRQVKKETNEMSKELIDHVPSDGSEQKQNNFSRDEGVSQQAKKETNENSEELDDPVPSDGSEQKHNNFSSDEAVSRYAKKETKSKKLTDHIASDSNEQKHNYFTSDSSQTCTCSVHPKIVRYIKDALMNNEKLVPYLEKKNLSELAQLLDEPCTCNQSTRDKLFRELIEFIENNKIEKTASPTNSPQESELNLLKHSKDFKDSMNELFDNVLNIIFLQLSGEEIDLTLKNMSQCPSNASVEVQNFVFKDITSQCKLSDECEEETKAIVQESLPESDSKDDSRSILRNPGKCHLETARCSNNDMSFTNNRKDFCSLSMGYSRSSCSISENSITEETNENDINTIKVTNQNTEPFGNNEISNTIQQDTNEYNLLSHSSTNDMLETNQSNEISNFDVGDNSALHTHSILCECIPHEGGAAVPLLGASESVQLSNTTNNHNLDVLRDEVDNDFGNEACNEDNINDMHDSSSADLTFCRNIMWSFGSSESGFENTDIMGRQNSGEIIGDDVSQANQMSNADMSMTNSELLAVRTSQSSSDTTESVQTDLVLGPKLMSESLNSCANCESISTTNIQDTEESESNTNIKKLVSTSLNEIFLQKLPENDTLEDDDEEEDDEAEENIRGIDAVNSWQSRWTKKPEIRKIKRCPKEFSIHFNCLEGYSYHSPDQNETPPADKIICGPDPYINANKEKQCDIINIKPFTECPYPSQIILVEDIKKTESQPLKTVTPQIFAVVNLPMSFFNIPKRIQSCIYLTPLQMAQLEESDSEDGFDKQSKSMPLIRSKGNISLSGIHIDQISCRNEYNTDPSKIEEENHSSRREANHFSSINKLPRTSEKLRSFFTLYEAELSPLKAKLNALVQKVRLLNITCDISDKFSSKEIQVNSCDIDEGLPTLNIKSETVSSQNSKVLNPKPCTSEGDIPHSVQDFTKELMENFPNFFPSSSPENCYWCFQSYGNIDSHQKQRHYCYEQHIFEPHAGIRSSQKSELHFCHPDHLHNGTKNHKTIEWDVQNMIKSKYLTEKKMRYGKNTYADAETFYSKEGHDLEERNCRDTRKKRTMKVKISRIT